MEVSDTVEDSFLPKNLICFSHLRWDFVYQRPQHLLTRFSKVTKVFFIEEPFFDSENPHYTIQEKGKNLYVIHPHLPHGLDEQQIVEANKNLLNQFISDKPLDDVAFWYYTPMALSFSSHLHPALILFDCMDELSAFKFAPPQLRELERQLLEKSDIVFTGGHSLYQAKKNQHHNIHPFPSSIDKEHFGKSRNQKVSLPDHDHIPSPRLGFYGVIDERFDIKLIEEVANLRPDWQIVLIGPVVKIDESTLPRNKNIHYLGGKNYNELPHYLSNWDVALIPFELNESTRFISPTKTPEYLAAGIPVISTSITDVVNPYREKNLVEIADTCAQFIKSAEKILSPNFDKISWLNNVDDFLQNISWDHTVEQMKSKIKKTMLVKNIYK